MAEIMGSPAQGGGLACRAETLGVSRPLGCPEMPEAKADLEKRESRDHGESG